MNAPSQLSGLAIGSPLCFLAARLLAHALYGTSRFQPLVLLAAGFTLLFAALFVALIPAFVPALIPALRAASVDPMQALRTE